MPAGGKREGAGRPKGSRNKRTVQMIDDAKRAGLLPHEFLAAVARGESFPAAVFDEHGQPVEGVTLQVHPTLEQRIACATAAAPYYASRRASVAISGDITITKTASEYTDDELASMLAQYEHLERAAAAGAVHPAGDPQPAKGKDKLSRVDRRRRA